VIDPYTVEKCAQIADALTNKWGQPNGEDYQQGMNDHGIRIASQIRALAPKDAEATSVGAHEGKCPGEVG
jgi:hypothetical protein